MTASKRFSKKYSSSTIGLDFKRSSATNIESNFEICGLQKRHEHSSVTFTGHVLMKVRVLWSSSDGQGQISTRPWRESSQCSGKHGIRNPSRRGWIGFYYFCEVMFGMFLFSHFSKRLGNRYFSFPLQSSVPGKWLDFSFDYLWINLCIYYFVYFPKEVICV